MRINSIRFKISVLYTSILGIILVAYSSILYFSLQWTLYDDLDNELRVKAKVISDTITSYLEVFGSDKETFLFTVKRIISKEGERPDNYKIMELERQWLQRADKLDIEGDYIELLSPKGEVLAGAGDLSKSQFSFLSKSIKDYPLNDEEFASLRFENRNLRVINSPFLYNGEKYIIQVATSLKPIIEILQTRLIFIMITILVILLFSSVIGQFFATKILNPVKEITLTTKNITHKDLSTRVKAEHADEEMEDLVNTFNEMIDRLEKSFKHISEFSSNVAHELKTPLAILRGESELALRKERPPEEYKRVIKGTLDETSRMSRLIEDLLLLSKLEYQTKAFKFEPVEIKQFLKEIYEQARLLASQKDISINLELPERSAVVSGDRMHLRRLFLNLIYNAVKFTSAGGKIDIEARYKDKQVFVSIQDTGLGISKEDLPKIFDKFFHTEQAGLNIEPGTGLGLNIALTIARIHNGDIEVKSERGKGSTFTLTLPLA